MKETISWNKDAHKAMCQNSTVENKRKDKSIKKKAASKAMNEKPEEAFTA